MPLCVKYNEYNVKKKLPESKHSRNVVEEMSFLHIIQTLITVEDVDKT